MTDGRGAITPAEPATATATVMPPSTPSSASAADAHDPRGPDSPRAWLVVLGSFLAQFVVYGFLTSFGLYTTVFAAFSPDPTLVALVGSVELAGMFVGGMAGAKLVNKRGPRVAVAAGAVLWLLGMFLGSAAQEYYQIMLTQGVLCGLGTGLVYLASVAVIPQWFERHRGLAVSLANAGGGLGCLVWALAGSHFISSVGWRTELRIIGGAGAVLLAAAALLVDRRLPPVPLPPGGALAFNAQLFVRDANYRWLIASILLFAFAFFTPFVLLPAWVVQNGLGGSSEIATTIALLGAGVCAGRSLAGVVARAVGSATATVRACALGASLTTFLWPTAATLPDTLAFAFFYAAFTGAYVSVLPLVLADLWGAAAVPVVMAVGNAAFVPGSLAAATIAARWAAAADALLPVAMFDAALLLLAFGCLLALRRPLAADADADADVAKPPPPGVAPGDDDDGDVDGGGDEGAREKGVAAA